MKLWSTRGTDHVLILCSTQSISSQEDPIPANYIVSYISLPDLVLFGQSRMELGFLRPLLIRGSGVPNPHS